MKHFKLGCSLRTKQRALSKVSVALNDPENSSSALKVAEGIGLSNKFGKIRKYRSGPRPQSAAEGGITTSAFVEQLQISTESLILAQDERWRRA